MAQKKTQKTAVKKKTSIGNSPRTKTGKPGPNGGNKHYKKRYRGQGKGQQMPPNYLSWGVIL